VKLALGTAQIGLNYGISNQRGQVSIDEAAAILRCARAAGITMLDTAVSYGDGEKRLGDIGVQGWHVISKLPSIPDDVADVERWITDTVRRSLENLRIDQLYGLLLHRPSQLTETRGDVIYAALLRLREINLVRNIGISIYEPSELEPLHGRFELNIVQAPLNLFDQRLIETGWLDRLAAGRTEVHARSVFLQGLLLFTPEDRPAKFNRWNEHFRRYDSWLRQHARSRLEACLAFVLSIPQITNVVVGVESASQLGEVVAAAADAPSLPARELTSTDPVLIDPRAWSRV
jgi:aryl-alcohol dehydrogenase-like predicted oxidoreductase